MIAAPARRKILGDVRLSDFPLSERTYPALHSAGHARVDLVSSRHGWRQLALGFVRMGMLCSRNCGIQMIRSPSTSLALDQHGEIEFAKVGYPRRRDRSGIFNP